MAAILDLANMADKMAAELGPRKKLIQDTLNYKCAKFHAFAKL